MFRHPREIEPSAVASELSLILLPIPVSAWGPLALHHLGVPIGVAIHHVVVRDEDYPAAFQKLLDSGFVATVPNRNPPPEVMAHLPDPQTVLRERTEGYKRLDRFTTTFNYPSRYPERKEQVVIIPNSFAHLPLWPPSSTLRATIPTQTFATSHYDVYNNMFYPLEQELVESYVKAALDEEKDNNLTLWGSLLESWISMMAGYLNVNNDILDNCEDHRAVKWYSVHFGRVREAKYGLWDRRITKRLGSGKEMPVDMRGNPVG